MLCYLAVLDDEVDRREFETLYQEYRQTMFYAANRILRDEYLAEDAVHNAFMKVAQNFKKISGQNSHKQKAFLVITVEHIAIDFYRKRRRENWASWEEWEGYEEDVYPAENESNLTKAILKLPIAYNTVLQLKYIYGYTDTEIASYLDITLDNVRQRISRAKRKLKEILEKEGERPDGTGIF